MDTTDVVTRIMPTGQTKKGETLYLPELYVDSENISAYPHPKWIHLDVEGAKIGSDGIGNQNQAFAKMREAAQAAFDKGCDQPTVTLTVDFLNLFDTEEYKQYGFLQNIFLGDSVRLIASRLGLSVSMRMTQYNARFSEINMKYDKLKASCETPEEAIQDKIARKAEAEDFIRELMKQPALVTEFDPIAYHILVDRITVFKKDRVVVRFKNGVEIEA